MRDETTRDNRQTTAWINHDLTGNNELAFSSTQISVLPFSNAEIVLFLFQLVYRQRIDMNDMLVTYY